MKKSESIAKIAPAIVAMQAELGNTKKTKLNPFYKKMYASLDVIINDIKPVLAKHGLCVLQDIETRDDRVIVTTMLLHESGEWIEQEGLALKLEKVTSQGAGIVITYGRRYSLAPMLNIASEEDDDGNISEDEKDKNNQVPKKPVPQKPAPKNEKSKGDLEEFLKLMQSSTSLEDLRIKYEEYKKYTWTQDEFKEIEGEKGRLKISLGAKK